MRTACAALLLLFAAAAPSGAAELHLEPSRSSMTVYVYRQGLFSFLADDHVIAAPIASGSFDPARGSVAVRIDAARLQVLDPHLSAGTRAQVQANMLGPKVLDAARYPTISFVSTSIDKRADGTWMVTGNLSLHGQTRSIAFPVRPANGERFTGTARVRQSAFGITPIRVAGGLVSVRDDVLVKFDAAFAPSPRTKGRERPASAARNPEVRRLTRSRSRRLRRRAASGCA